MTNATEQTRVFNTAEEWREIPGTDYSVSSEGRAASRKRGGWRVLKPAPNGTGYLTVVFWKRNTGRTRAVHQLVADAFLGPKPSPNHQINHKNGDRLDNQVENLEWVTARQNQRHRFDILGHGNARGEKNGGAKFTETEVREVRSRCAAGETQKRIASTFGVGRHAIGEIITRKTWGWLV